LASEFQTAGVPFEPPRVESFLDSDGGRLVLALVRIVCDANDYVAHRVMLGLFPGVGVGTCNAICQAVIYNNLNYRDIFYRPLPTAVFTGRIVTALNVARGMCGQISSWQAADTLAQRTMDIAGIVTNVLGIAHNQAWQNYAASLPSAATLEELRDFLWADTDEQQAALLQTVYTRLNQAIPIGGLSPARIRVMTMHTARRDSPHAWFLYRGLRKRFFQARGDSDIPALSLKRPDFCTSLLLVPVLPVS